MSADESTSSPAISPLPQDAAAGTLLGRDFIAAVVVFHELVGRRLGLSATDRKCLDLLSRGPVTAGDVARFTGLTTGAATGIIDRLVKADYAERTADPEDRRRTIVRRKANGRLDAVMQEVFAPLGQDMASLTASYSHEQLVTIADFLTRTREVLLANTRRLERVSKRAQPT